MARKKVTMQTIADQLNVSKVTVHKALNGKSDISDKLRETILQKSIDLGYENIDPLAKHCRNFFFLISKEFYHSSEQYYRNFFNKLSTLFDSYGIRLELKLIENYFDATRFVINIRRLYCRTIQQKNFAKFGRRKNSGGCNRLHKRICQC